MLKGRLEDGGSRENGVGVRNKEEEMKKEEDMRRVDLLVSMIQAYLEEKVKGSDEIRTGLERI